MHNERRQTARFPVELDIDIVLEDGSILPVKTLNISHNGMQFRCDGYTANEIEPRGIHNHSLDHLKMKAIAQLPVDGKKKLYASCHIISARRLSQEEYLLGLEFYDFEKNSDKALQDYIDILSSGISG
ncbi:PilZ domain-containing protein [Pseudomonadota bacterium]